jgi:uncharacterized protein YrrD
LRWLAQPDEERAMLRHESKINGYAVHASDGLVGAVCDFLFDDATWRVHWLVIDAGDWLHDCKVLLPPSALEHVNYVEHRFDVRLTRQQVKDCPEADTERPVSRQQKTKIYDYYSWSPYWGNGSYMDVMGYGGFLGGSLAPTPTAESMTREKEIDDVQRRKNDPNLRSVKEVTGYHIHASDGEIGHVEDLLIEDDDWSIHYFVVDTKNWSPGNRVLISPLFVQSIQWSDRLVNLKINRQKVKDGRAFDPSAKIDPISKKNIHKPNSDFRLWEGS